MSKNDREFVLHVNLFYNCDIVLVAKNIHKNNDYICMTSLWKGHFWKEKCGIVFTKRFAYYRAQILLSLSVDIL